MAKDLFSRQAATYAGFRPGYPESVIQHILQLTPGRESAWDCATGNGQAAILLAPHFKNIYATDISEKQLSNAVTAPNIQYIVAPAEDSGLAAESIDLVTVAQAYHWFDFNRFEMEIRRVLKPAGRVAIWGYGLFYTKDDFFNQAIHHFYSVVLGKYWDAERIWVDKHYSTVPFPFDPLPGFETIMQYNWDKEKLQGFLNSWSAVQNYIREHSIDPVATWMETVSGFVTEPFQVFFPVFLKMGRIQPAG
jgi:ubiquinone/menaquinone biosynthesis C-methylase UbiE